MTSNFLTRLLLGLEVMKFIKLGCNKIEIVYYGQGFKIQASKVRSEIK